MRTRIKGVNAVKKFKVLFFAVCLLILTVIQPTLIQMIKIFGVSPDLFLVFVLIAAFARGKESGAVTGFFFGLLLDIMIGRFVGICALTYMFAGLLAGFLQENILGNDSIIVFSIVALAEVFVCELVYFIVYSMTYGGSGFVNGFLVMVCFKAIYTTFAAILLYKPILRCFDMIKDK